MFSGLGKGFDVDLIKLILEVVSFPVIASSGVGTPAHFFEVFNETNASTLVASIFHMKEVLLLFHYFLRAVRNDFNLLIVFYDMVLDKL